MKPNALLILALALLPTIAFGQFQLDIEQLAVNTNQVVEEVDVEPQPQERNAFGFDVEQNLDGWVFQQQGGAASAKRYLENRLKARLASLSRDFDLRDDQRRKLMLAGKGDMQDFFAEVDVIRAEFKGVRDQNKINNVFERIRPLQERMGRGLFSSGSVLQKVTNRILDEEQRDDFNKRETERLEAAYRAAIKFTISELEKSTPLTASQREEIVTILEASPAPKANGQYIAYYVLCQLSKNEKQVKEILDPGQAKAMQQAFNQGRGMEQFLRQNGFIE